MSINTEITITVAEAQEIVKRYLVLKYDINEDNIKSFGLWSARQQEYLGKDYNNLYLMKIKGNL